MTLIDTGSQINGIYLPISSIWIKGATGKSKLLRSQVLRELTIKEFQEDMVFLIITKLNKDCIGITSLQHNNSIIDLPKKQIQLNGPVGNEHTRATEAAFMTIQTDNSEFEWEKLENEINGKVN